MSERKHAALEQGLAVSGGNQVVLKQGLAVSERKHAPLERGLGVPKRRHVELERRLASSAQGTRCSSENRAVRATETRYPSDNPPEPRPRITGPQPNKTRRPSGQPTTPDRETHPPPTAQPLPHIPSAGSQSSIRFPSGSTHHPNRPNSESSVCGSTSTPRAFSFASRIRRSSTRRFSMARCPGSPR